MHRYHLISRVSGTYPLPNYMPTPSGTAAATIVIPVLLILLAILFVVTPAHSAPRAAEVVDDQQSLEVRGDVDRSLWVSSSEDIIYNVGTAKQDLFAFCANPKGALDPTSGAFAHRAITRLFVNAHGFIVSGQEEADSLRSFLREAHRRGLTVEFTDGEPTWINKNAGDANLVMNALVTYQRQSTSEERFDGVLLRVEPYLLRGWYSQTLWNQYMQFLSTMRAKLDVPGAKTPFGVTIPRWIDQTLGMASLTEIYGKVDNVLVLANVDQQRVLVDCISNEVALGDSMGVHVYAGVETGTSVISNSSFHEAGWLAMEEGLAAVNKAYIFDHAYAGVVINDYQSFRGMRRTPHSLQGLNDATPLPEYVPASNTVVVENALDRFLQKKDVQRLQYTGNRVRAAYAQIPLTALLTVQYHFGATPLTPLASVSADVRAKSVDELHALAERLVKLGFDGVVIDASIVPDLYGKANVELLHHELVAGTSQFAHELRANMRKASAPIIMRGGDVIASALDDDDLQMLAATVDGVMPVTPVSDNKGIAQTMSELRPQ